MVSEQSVLRYPGGKTRACKTLSDLLPETFTKVYSPFLGGGSFELFITHEYNVPVYAIDKFSLLSHFWETLLEDPVRLAKTLSPLVGTITRESFSTWLRDLKQRESLPHELLNFDDAWQFFVVNRCSFSGATLSGGFSAESARTRFTDSIVQKVRNFSNPLLNVQYGDVFSDAIPQDTDFIFYDPPYFLPEDSANSLYGVNGLLHKGFDHAVFYDLVSKVNTPWMVTYNNDDHVKKLWKDFRIKEVSWVYGMNASKQSSEIVIRNY